MQGEPMRDPRDATWATIFGMAAAMLVFVGVIAYMAHPH